MIGCKAYEQIQKTGEMTLFKSHPDYEDGKQMRDFLYVKDAVCITLGSQRTRKQTVYLIWERESPIVVGFAHAIFSALKMNRISASWTCRNLEKKIPVFH